jgi:hypothetical protein
MVVVVVVVVLRMIIERGMLNWDEALRGQRIKVKMMLLRDEVG